MKKLKSTLKLIELSSLALSLAFHKTIINWLQKNDLIKEGVISFIVSIVIIILIFLIIDFILDKIVELKFIRKLILGEDYIEGQWAELAYDATSNTDISYSLLTIKGDGESLVLNGDSFDVNTFVHIGSFVSNSITYEYPHLFYNYKYDINSQINSKEGMSRIKFISRIGKEPLIHTGFFIDIDSNKKVNFISWKIIDKKLVAKLSNPENFKTEITSFIAKMRQGSIAKQIKLEKPNEG